MKAKKLTDRLVPSSEHAALFIDPVGELGADARWVFENGQHRRISPAEVAEFLAPSEEDLGYDFDEAFPEPTRAHIVIDGDVSDAKALRDAARKHSAEALGYIVTIMRYSRDEKVKLTAADLILNRAIGKPVAPTGVMEGNELKEALGSIVLPEKRKIKEVNGALQAPDKPGVG